MKKLFTYYLILPAFVWLSIFGFLKAIFLIFHFNSIQNEAFTTVVSVFFKSLNLDFSSIAYILIFPFFLLVVQYFWHSSLLKKIFKYYHFILAFILSFINVVDIFLFASWSSKISLKSLLFAKMPLQVLSTMGSFNVILAVFFMALHLVISFFLIQKILSKTKFKVIRNSFSFLVYITISAFLIVVFLRGGLQSVPINQSAVYLYQNNTLNVAGVNPLWNFMNTLVQNKKYLNENPYNKIDKEKAKKYVKDLFKVKKDTTTSLFKINKPNIIFIALEGVNANVFKSFGAKNSFAPSLDSLFQHGFLFTEMYSAGFRSDQGMLAIYGGFPPTPVSSIAAQPEKFKHLPSLSKKIMKEEYHCSYFMGVEPEFGNLKSFLVYNGFDKLIDIKDFSPKQKTTSLGVPDEFLFHKFLNEMETVSEPFYSMIFTATTHEPFDMPFNKGVKEERQRYLNTVAYLDTVLIDFMHKAKQMPWYENTVFIISSDHAHSQPNDYYFDANERYHIPFFIFGKPLRQAFVNKRNSKICSQVDIPKTILEQLNITTNDFKWSKDLMNPYSKEFAFYTYIEGYVLKTEQCNNGWEYRYDKPFGKFNPEDSTFCQEQGQAFLQELYDNYLNY